MASTIFCYSDTVRLWYRDASYRRDCRPSDRIRFSIALKSAPDKPLYTIITNGDGCGRFLYDERACAYRQTRGTCQYSLPGTVQGLRQQLKSELKAELTRRAYETLDGITEEEQQILEAL